MAALEQLVLDGLALNDGTTWVLEAMVFSPAQKRFDRVQGADADGSRLVRPPRYDDAVVELRLRVVRQSTMDTALTVLGGLTAKLQEAELLAADTGRGMGLVWTPADSTYARTLYVKGGEVLDRPVAVEGEDAGWFLRSPVVNVRLTCDPFMYGAEVGSWTDDFSTNTIANYTFDTGGGTLSVSGGQLVPSSTAEKRLYHTATSYSDTQVTLKITTGASVASPAEPGVIVKRLDATNYLRVTLFGGTMYLAKVDAGVATNLATVAAAWSAATSYWLRLRVEGNLLTAEFFTAAPTATSTPTATVSYTLAGADATKFGSGIVGNVGMRLIPQATDWRYDDFVVDPNTYKSSLPLVLATVSNVPGDVAAEAALTVIDSAGQARQYVAYGLEQRNYSAATSLLLEADSGLTVTGFAGSATTRTGAYS